MNEGVTADAMYAPGRFADMAGLPTVSVIVPCFNYGRYLRECVESVLNQTGVNVRVLIVDDASTDSTAQVAAELMAEDPRVELIQHPVNLGPVRTYNEGLFLADAAYTAMLDPDDSLTAGSLARACALMNAHPEVGLVYGRALLFTEDQPRPQPATGPARETIWRGRDWFEARCRLIENCIRSPEVVMRTSVLRRLGGFREELPHTGDLELWMRFALHADVGYIAGPDQALYRDHSAGMHRARFGSDLVDHQQMMAAFELLFLDHKALIFDAARVQRVVRVALSRRALRLACRSYDREPFDAAQAQALEQLSGVASHDARTIWVRCCLRARKTIGTRRWRSLLRIRHVLTIVSRRWEYYRYRSQQRAGLSL